MAKNFSALVQHSIELIRQHQSPSGAYIASPNFKTYHYAWFRDGTFVAYAMDVVGAHDSAEKFYDWSAQTVLRHADAARAVMNKAARGEALVPNEGLHTRYTLDGEIGSEDWANFQLDGFGTWLWGAVHHLQKTENANATRWRDALALVAEYVAALWQLPNYDCWEEFGDRVHISTLAALYGGMRAYAEWSGDTKYERVARDIRAFVLAQGVRDGHLIKFIGNENVDAALIGAAVPYGLLALDDARTIATIQKIERDLAQHIGVHRYAADVYYGGGEWILLTAWLGWYHARAGNQERARACLEWASAQAGADLDLPEQVPLHLNAPAEYAPWVARWGKIAKPLLWSHAKFLILWSALGAKNT